MASAELFGSVFPASRVMLRILAIATLGVFWTGFYAGMHAESLTCHAVHGLRPSLAWIDC